MDSFIKIREKYYLDNRISVSESKDCYFISYSDDLCHGLFVTKDFCSVIMRDKDSGFTHFMDILYQIYSLYLINNKLSLCIHASSISVCNVAIAFIGISGIGKSTQSRLWVEQLNAKVINFDKPALIKTEVGYSVCGTPWGWKENYITKISAPLYCIVSLKQSKTNTARKLAPSEAFLTLYGLFMPLLINERTRELYELIINDIAKKISVYEYQCTPDIEAVNVLYDTLFKDKPKEKRAKQMRIKDGYILKQILDDWIVIPRGDMATSCRSTLLLNETGLLIWKCLAKGFNEEEIIKKFTEEYSAPNELVEKDIKEYISRLLNEGYIEMQD